MICVKCGKHFSYRRKGYKRKGRVVVKGNITHAISGVLCPRCAGYKEQEVLGSLVMSGDPWKMTEWKHQPTKLPRITTTQVSLKELSRMAKKAKL